MRLSHFSMRQAYAELNKNKGFTKVRAIDELA